MNNKRFKQRASNNMESFQMIPDLPPESMAISGMLTALSEASNHQMDIALELTKIIVGKQSQDTITEKDILSTFKRSLELVNEQCRLKDLWEHLD